MDRTSLGSGISPQLCERGRLPRFGRIGMAEPLTVDLVGKAKVGVGHADDATQSNWCATRPATSTMAPWKAFMMQEMNQAPTAGQRPIGAEAEAEEPRTFERFFREEAARLFRALYLITGHRDEAEDIVQEAFLKTWERWERVRAMDDPAGYLYRIALNSYRSRYRRAVRAARHAIGRSEPRDAFAQIDQRDEVARALRSLPPRRRAAVILTEFLGYSASEAAEPLGVKPATVRSLASLGRATLREAMGAEDA
jgi:RNA polymerase sigma factor (sigma-70 family)